MQKKQIGQLFIVGYQGEEPTGDFLRFVEEWGIGGVIVFARNLSDPSRLPAHLEKIAEASGQKIFTAIDQEGGLVLRILSKGSLFSSAMALAATNSLELTEQSYQATGKEMLSLGLNWNLAPVLDINHPDNPGIGARSFSDQPFKVADYGCAAIRGMQKAGVLACAKHFPGKGHARVDSHLTLPVIPHTCERLDSFELIPFKKAIQNGVDAIMTSHVFFPAYESAADLPATLSKSVLTDLLRHQLDFKGILVTDDLEMGAITESFGIAQAASMSFHAGADLLLICHSLNQQRLAAETLLNDLKHNRETGVRLSESLERITAARQKLATHRPAQNLETLKEIHSPLIEKIHEQSIKFLRVDPRMVPLKTTGADTLFVIPQISSLVQVEEEHRQESLGAIIKNEFAAATVVVYDPKASAEQIIAQISAEHSFEESKNVQMFFFTYNSHILKEQQSAIEHFAKIIKNIAVIALRNPYDLAACKSIKTCAATFGFRTPAIKALLKALKGDIAPATTLWPISIEGWS